MADAPLTDAPLTDALRVERAIRGIVARLAGRTGPRPHELVARTARLDRMGLTIPDIEALEEEVLETYGVRLIIGTNDTPAGIADQIAAALARREVAHV